MSKHYREEGDPISPFLENVVVGSVARHAMDDEKGESDELVANICHDLIGKMYESSGTLVE